MSKEMEKQERDFQISHGFDWTYSVEISQIRKDLDELEKLGATRIEIEAQESYGSCSVSIEAFARRIETDEEYSERMNKAKQQQGETERRELELLQKLKSKYNQ